MQVNEHKKIFMLFMHWRMAFTGRANTLTKNA